MRPVRPAAAARGAAAAQTHYQAAAYAHAAAILPDLITGADITASESPGRDAYRAQARVYIAAAKLTVKLRSPHAWLAADRAMTAARLAEDPLLICAATYQLACALLRTGQTDAAERLTATARPADATPEGVSHAGALMLLSAVIAGRRGDGAEAYERLTHAARLAERLDGERNHGWTAFGAVNVEVHRVSVAVGLGDPGVAAAAADAVRTDRLPAGLRARRAHVRVEGAWGLAHRRRDVDAVAWLADAERTAPLMMRSSPLAHTVLRDLLARERRDATPALRGLCRRAGIMPA